MNAAKTIALTTVKTSAKRMLSLCLFIGAFALISHFVPATMTMVPPEKGAAHAAEVSKSDKAFERAMRKCETLPDGAIPGAAVVDFTGELPRYTSKPSEVTIAFEYGVSSYMGEKKIAHDEIVEGVTLCA